MIPEKVSAKDNRGFFLRDDDDGIATGVAGKILDMESERAEAQLGFGIVKHRRCGEIFDLRFLFGSNVLAEKF